MRLKHSEVKPLREKLLKEQRGCCRLCGQPIVDDAVLDHDHKTGQLRGVLHRGCNSLLGKIENNMPRSLVDLGRLSAISQNLIRYLTATPVSEFLHPTHLTKEERHEKLARKRKQNRKKQKETQTAQA
jgi:hypothetical protein